jgi:hypothetical protein
MYKIKKIGKLFTSKFYGTGPSYYEKNFMVPGPRLMKKNLWYRALVLWKKFYGTGPSSYEKNFMGPGRRLMKKIYRAAVFQSLRNTAPHDHPDQEILQQYKWIWLASCTRLTAICSFYRNASTFPKIYGDIVYTYMTSLNFASNVDMLRVRITF